MEYTQCNRIICRASPVDPTFIKTWKTNKHMVITCKVSHVDLCKNTNDQLSNNMTNLQATEDKVRL